jgi:3-phenylpropionate/trans-cinnamate dioxygenase ferredoxin reductase subunit
MAAGTLIIGAGQGGYQVAASLREAGYTEPVTIVGNEPVLPYQRPPLSKAYLLGETTAERLQLRPQSYYDTHVIGLIAGETATGIDRPARRVTLASGKTVPYEHLVLATGARNRALPVPGAEADDVLYLRTLAEADAIRERFHAAQSIVVAGAGFIGLELAAVASKFGKQVTVLEALGRCMSRAVSMPVSSFFAEAHASWGVQLLFGAQLASIDSAGGRVTGVTTADGRRIAADLVLVGIGIVPETGLAERAGLRLDNGIAIDAQLLTSDPAISAIGDCASFPDAATEARLRLESVQNAVDQGRYVAQRIIGRAAGGYAAVPWFWSDQCDLKLQMVGLTALRPDSGARRSSDAGVFGVLLQGRPAARHRVSQSRRRPHVRAAATRRRPVAHARGGGRSLLRLQGPSGQRATRGRRLSGMAPRTGVG